ncbi:unnamed protein product [Cyprideis torosa]|uniref:Uncharacterized protein n=1 Tax=Cyprideis torosa TaxID=163714 RepID=A0A7R8ZN07_9CRUS|nr:unnamed protein product [Cyprideis torosa]CAG0885531.1 unnamed protein product [Cyprideis torosa]
MITGIKGTSPVTRGCISGSLPLLCQGKRPKVQHEKWPYLVCCSKNMCNKRPVAPIRVPEKGSQNGEKGQKENQSERRISLSIEDIKALAESMAKYNDDDFDPRIYHSSALSPISVGVLAVGLVMIISLGGLGMFIINRQRLLSRTSSRSNRVWRSLVRDTSTPSGKDGQFEDSGHGNIYSEPSALPRSGQPSPAICFPTVRYPPSPHRFRKLETNSPNINQRKNSKNDDLLQHEYEEPTTD